MHEPALATHADLRVRVEHVGDTRIPLVVIDNLLNSPEDLVAFAAASVRLAPPTDMYPGLRAPAPASYVEVLRQVLPRVINQSYALADFEIQEVISYLCVVTTRPEDLRPVQSLPHIDGAADHAYSTVHYLCSPSYAGTSLYRHRRTGYAIIPEYRHEHYRSVLRQELAERPGSTPGYIGGDTALFERLYATTVAFNRLVLYPSNVLHSADIGADFGFDADPRQGRFSVNSRIQMRPRGHRPRPWF